MKFCNVLAEIQGWCQGAKCYLFFPLVAVSPRSGPECMFSCCHLGLQGTLVMNISSKCLLPHFALGKKCLTQTEFNQSANLFQVSPASSVNVFFSSLHCCWKQIWKPFFNKIYLICENNLLCIAGVQLPQSLSELYHLNPLSLSCMEEKKLLIAGIPII